MLTEDEKRKEIKEGMKRQDIFFYIWAVYILGILILGSVTCYMAYYK